CRSRINGDQIWSRGFGSSLFGSTAIGLLLFECQHRERTPSLIRPPRTTDPSNLDASQIHLLKKEPRGTLSVSA
ncbi:hypothetical protein V3C99_018107, partial [Haemonchus contortus]